MTREKAIETNLPYFWFRESGGKEEWNIVTLSDVKVGEHANACNSYEYEIARTPDEVDSVVFELRNQRNRACYAEEEYEYLCQQIRNLIP